MTKPEDAKLNRRRFLQASSATAAGLLIASPRIAFGAEANEKLELGLIGCGNRGAWIGDLFQQNSNTKVVALHDYFQDRVQAAAERLEVSSDRCYIGLDGYKELLESGVDAVAVESPPYFHPEQTVAALEAGKHVYLAKPIAVDVPGCMAIVDAARKIHGKQTILVDFQTRNDPLFREAAQRIHDGMIGEVVCGQAYYHTGRLRLHAEPGTEVARLRNWVFDKALSGDIIVEQNIHVLDVANWFIGGHPVSAQGLGGRKARTDVGDCWDHFSVTYSYEDDVLLTFSSNQFAPGFNDLCTRVYGPLGTADAHYGGDVSIRGKSESWAGGKTSQIYRQGAVNNIKDFHASIVQANYLDNAEESAHSTMTSILGRTTAYEERPVTWKKMVKANVRLDPDLKLPADGPFTEA